MRLLASQLDRPGPIVVSPSRDPERQAQAAAYRPPLWPRYVNGSVVFRRIDPRQIPAGWQSVQFHIPMRLATCEEVACPMFERGWTEIVTGDGRHEPKAGAVTQDEAAATFGYYGPREIPPAVIAHPAGTPCPRLHKLPSGVPPLYTINGRPVLWNEFEDSIGGGIHHASVIAGK